MSIFGFEALAIITKFQPKFFRLVGQSRFEVPSVRVLERIGQRFLSDMEKIDLPGWREVRQFALGLEGCMQRCSDGRVLNSTFEGFPKIMFLQGVGTQRVDRPARFAQTAP